MGRWIGRLIILLLLLAACWAVLAFLGGPQESRVIEVDVTDSIGKMAPEQ